MSGSFDKPRQTQSAFHVGLLISWKPRGPRAWTGLRGRLWPAEYCYELCQNADASLENADSIPRQRPNHGIKAAAGHCNGRHRVNLETDQSTVKADVGGESLIGSIVNE